MKIIFILLVLFFVGCGSSNPKSEEGVIIDSRTKLMWQDNLVSEVDTMNWNQAIKYWTSPNTPKIEDIRQNVSICDNKNFVIAVAIAKFLFLQNGYYD